jgi:hypothetical protein
MVLGILYSSNEFQKFQDVYINILQIILYKKTQFEFFKNIGYTKLNSCFNCFGTC